jgi:hypothetical protein
MLATAGPLFVDDGDKNFHDFMQYHGSAQQILHYHLLLLI